jgi:hypothetical protein
MSAISRDHSEIVFRRVHEIRDEVFQHVKEKASEVNQVTDPYWDAAPLLNEGYKEFVTKVHQEYDRSPYATFAELLLPNHKLYFFSSRHLQGEVRQILQERCH